MLFTKLTLAALASWATLIVAAPEPQLHDLLSFEQNQPQPRAGKRQSCTNPKACPANSVYKSTVHPPTVFFRPEKGKSISYPRLVELSDGTILTTASYSGTINGKPYFPIFASCDGGNTWSWRSNLTDQVNGLGMSAQPALSELPWDLGTFKKGTVLASGNSWGNTTNIDLYASTDKGVTWKFVSNVARGSKPGTQDGNPCIWEPWIQPYNNTVGVFYSDQRDPGHSQKLAHQESTDLLTWGPVIDDVSFLAYHDRPGMTVITYLPPTKQWMLVHEFPGGGTADSSNWGVRPNPVYFRFANSPFNFRFGYSYPITVDRVQPNASPYVVWTPKGGVNGTIIVSDNHWNSVFTNTFNGEPDKWEEHASGAPKCYSRPLHISSDNPDHVLIVSAGSDGANGTAMTSTISSLAQIFLNPIDPNDINDTIL